jgi:phage shock protein A
MNELDRLHQEAMDLVDQATLARRRGDLDHAKILIKSAFTQEQAAAALTESQFDLEPTRSVLHRSAAALAIECTEFRAAEKLIGRALAGNPPAEIADELRDLLLTEIYPKRQLLTA